MGARMMFQQIGNLSAVHDSAPPSRVNPIWIAVVCLWVAFFSGAGRAAESGQWSANGGTPAGQFYSPLKQIDRASVSRLGFAWQFKTGTFRGMEGTPLVVDGVMYVPGIWGFVYA